MDSQGNAPCQAGNTCYNDWFLPALDQLGCLMTNKASIGGFPSAGNYWSSSQHVVASGAKYYTYNDGLGTLNPAANNKNNSFQVRCARAFTP